MKKILIVEDSVQILAQLSYIAREINSSNKIYAFEKLEEAYRCTLENDIDLFVVDIILEKEKPGDISGLQYVENIRKIDRYKFIPVIFVTSLEDAKLHTYEKLHCYSFIEKPFDESKMKNVMEECLQFYELFVPFALAIILIAFFVLLIYTKNHHTFHSWVYFLNQLCLYPF